MPIKTAQASWNGTLTEGNGHLRSQTGVVDADYNWKARAEDAPGTNPEELIASAHAGCFSMALSKILADAGNPPTKIETRAEVSFEKVGDGFGITGIKLITQAQVQGLDDAGLQKHAEAAKSGCPVSKALSVPISLEAKLA